MTEQRKLAFARRLVFFLREFAFIPLNLEWQSLWVTVIVSDFLGGRGRFSFPVNWTLLLPFPFRFFPPTGLESLNAKIRAIEAKLQMMEENPDEQYSGPSVYLYNKPPEKKRPAPYGRHHRKHRRWRGGVCSARPPGAGPAAVAWGPSQSATITLSVLCRIVKRKI